MKKINILLAFTVLLMAGGLLSSCKKEESLKQDKPSANQQKSVEILCEECVPTWLDTKVTWDATHFIPQSINSQNPDNLFLDVYNDETTIYYRLYRLNGATFNYLRINGNVVLNYTNDPVTEWNWTTPLSLDWEACAEFNSTLTVGGIHVHVGHVDASICYKLRDICEEVTCSAETAWAFGPRYVTRGNWATYTPYVPNSTVTIYAGQTMNIGTAHFSAIVNGEVTITINLTGDWSFNDVPSALKIQGYDVAPSGNPAPGLFEHHFNSAGSAESVTVPAANFFGVHIDAEICE